MKKIVYSAVPGFPRSSMDEEFLSHRGFSEWWYCTGCLQSPEGSMFAFQFTLAQVNVYGVKLHILMNSLTDLQTGKHRFRQVPVLFGRNIVATADTVALDGKASMSFQASPAGSKGRMKLHVDGDGYALDAEMEALKPPVWHCEDGVLQMGIPGDPKERTYYSSYTNLVTKARLVLEGREYGLEGKSWFDRQGGTYTVTDPRTGWEWFSLRFFDDHEVMLFAFPQDGHYDGTRIEKDGSFRRLNRYKLVATGVTETRGYKFSKGWTLEMDGEEYVITPKTDGMFNAFFFEQLAEVKDKAGRLLGYSFVELLPGVRNARQHNLDAFKRH